ncbi:Regulatory protein GAL4 [Madurella mycetomatis]|uniref:Regulatory protein GAL4 n=1 Tax=Madurella mycetomatis TaxID=100816 RepID=A0A175VUI2_9PEZI|nr:Regulatory protein GAL4 [Madurella mycetomatis]
MASSKPRQPRLRASCDGCFLAKVKCSKARPICSRCLTCGIECRYSPSSRAGKPKSDATSSTQASAPPDMSGMPSPVSDDKSFMYATPQPMTGIYKLDTGWNTPPTSVDGSMSRSHSMPGLAMMGMDMNAGATADPTLAADIYSAGMPWTPPGDVAPQYVESPAMTAHLGHGRSQSYDFTMSTSMWGDANTPDMYGYGHAQMAASYFPSPVPTPQQLRSGARHKSSPASSSGGSCTCFTACLQSLQALHNASTPAAPSFDTVLSLNRKAVEGCAAMLSCARCMSRSGTHTAAMLLATVIGKITSFYKNASHTYFEDGFVPAMGSPNGLGATIGQYTVMSDKWLELEILARELRKLEEVYAQFREVCADLSEDPEVSKAMIGYLGHNLGSTLEVIHHRKSDVGTYT